MSKNPNDKKDINDASLLSAAMVGAPTVGGFGYTLRDMMRHKQFRAPRETSFASASRRLGGFQRPRGVDPAQLYHDTGFLRSPAGGAIAKKAWNQAFGSAGKIPSNLLNYAGDLTGVADEDAFNAIERTVQANQSMFMRRVASRFRQNVTAFQRQAQLRGKIPNFIRAENFRFPSAVRNAQLPPELQPAFNRIRSTLGWGKADFYTRPGWEERGLGMYQLSFRHKNFEFTLPLPIANQGMLAEGLTQSSLKIAPTVHIFDPHSGKITQKMSRHEFVLRAFEEQIMPGIQSGSLKTSWDIQSAIDDLYQDTVRSLENVPNLLPGMNNQGQKSYATIRSNAVDIRILDRKGFRPPTGREFTAAMQAGNYFPETSPSNLAEGRVSLHDPRKWVGTPGAEDLSRRIAQANRVWRPTYDAVQEMMQTPWAIFETQAWRQDMGPYAAPHFKTMYVSTNRHRGLFQNVGMGDGEYLIRNSDRNRRALETFRAATPVRLKSIREDLQDIIETGRIKHGEVLGETLEGTPFLYDRSMELKGLEKFATVGSGEFYSLYYNQVQKVVQHTKGFFGAKGMRNLVSPSTFMKAESYVNKMTKNPFLTAGAEMIVSMDELKKNPARHNTQMITQLWALLNQMGARDARRRNAKIRAFLKNPMGAAGIFEKYATVGVGDAARYDHETFVKNLIKFSLLEGKLSPQEFGSVFGAVPDVVGSKGIRKIYTDLALNEFSFRHMRAMYRGIASGVTQTVFGGPKGDTGAGALGTLEPRVFDALRGGHFGTLGDDMTSEFMGQLAFTNPGKFVAHEALNKTLMSAAGKLSASGAIWDVTKDQYTQEGFQEFINKGGGFIRAPGMSDIFVPGGDIPAMGTYMTPADAEVRGRMSEMYHGYAREMERAGSTIARADIRKSFLAQLGKEHAPSGRGAGSFLRGKVAASRFFTGVTEAKGQRSTNIHESLIPRQYGLEMIDELGEIHGADVAESVRKRFLAGEMIEGGLMRHPDIGAYSAIPHGFRMLRGEEEPVIALPWFQANIRLAGEDKANPITLSPLIGQGGDLDADIFSAHLVSPKVGEKIRKQFLYADNEYTQAYMQHQVRAQLIKAKAAGKGGVEEISTNLKMIADAKKLSTAQEWVGRLSNELSVAREAVGSNMKGPGAGDARFLLEWLEQVPISGKHLSAQKVLSEEMSSFFKTIESSIRTRDPQRLTGAVRKILEESDSTSQRLLSEDIRIEEGADDIAKIFGMQKRDLLPGINLDRTSEDIMSSLRIMDSTGATDVLKLATARRSLSETTLGTYLSKVGGLLSGGPGLGATMSSTRQMVTNMMAAAGESIIRNKAAVGFGFAGSIALATILSTPRETVGPGNQMSAGKVNMNAGKAVKRMEPTEQPAGQSLGKPSVPNMIQNNSVSIAPASDSVRMQVRARVMGSANGSLLGSQMRMAGGRNTNVNVNVRDNSSSMSPHVLANKLF